LIEPGVFGMLGLRSEDFATRLVRGAFSFFVFEDLEASVVVRLTGRMPVPLWEV